MSHFTVLTGLDVLARDGCAPLHGRRVGLITNHTGLAADGTPALAVLQQGGVEVRALFGPEHGLKGQVDREVTDSADPESGLPVYSLYGAHFRPQLEHLKGLDALVFDVQDVGCRYYTYSATLGLCMEAAAEAGISYFVLDRPNPINGVDVEGPLADPDRLSFTAYHTAPIRHGLTLGELATLYRLERKIDVDLHVVAMDGWRREDFWDATNLTWVWPSPNMRSLTQALLYPGMGIPEFTNISVGRGTHTPFELIGAPWVDDRALAAALNARNLPGVRWVPTRFTPSERQHAGTECGGVNPIITERSIFRPVLAGLALVEELLTLFGEQWEPEKYLRLLANQRAFDALLRGDTAEELCASFEPGIAEFRQRREPALLYGHGSG